MKHIFIMRVPQRPQPPQIPTIPWPVAPHEKPAAVCGRRGRYTIFRMNDGRIVKARTPKFQF